MAGRQKFFGSNELSELRSEHLKLRNIVGTDRIPGVASLLFLFRRNANTLLVTWSSLTFEKFLGPTFIYIVIIYSLEATCLTPPIKYLELSHLIKFLSKYIFSTVPVVSNISPRIPG